ncbi:MULTISPECIES: hypothetical protein [Butyricimonas]|uniref:DUF4469 domain-containing protein n=1 Tax=Butyricimonas hominis TaxID=2763032 RepID=A0ABR7D458_9BACT|nr:MULTISPECIES: hypothetical protein [Butyricimonas]MBC5622300.1 hypothetical protein [Butyricimonas hominis]MCB6974461.1 hypothetical protein [Butyricimonas synergistica]MCG4521334.1 hypothetical protein [Butyricimonas sp. DFI.6.44]
MAIFDSHLFDNASGSVGNVTMCRFRNRNVVKAKISFKSKKQSTAQRVQQARFSILSALARYFCPAVQAGFPGKSYSEARTLFIGMNQKSVEIDEETLAATVHRERLTFSKGNLTPPAVEVTIHHENREVHVKWQRQALSPVAKDADDITLVLFDTVTQKSRVYPLGKRGTPGETAFPLHKKFTPGNTLAYAFAHSSVNDRASRSIFIEVRHKS